MNNKSFFSQNEKAIIIDGHSLAYRAFFATTQQQKYYKENNLPNYAAVRMMIIMIGKLLVKENYTYGLIAFDTSRKSFRTTQFENYKSNREAMPDDLIQQMPMIINALELFGFPIIAINNIEADDIIASFSKILTEQKIHANIFTSDRDLLQLVNDYTNINILKKGVSEILVYTKNNFQELTNGILPNQIADLKALIGDSSDNYKGVTGIGPKTALKLILKYKNINNIYNNLHELSSNIAMKLKKEKENAFLFLEIAKTLDNVLINKKISEFILSPIRLQNVQDFLKSLGLENLIKYYQL